VGDQGKRPHGECCPESSFEWFWDVKVSGKREFQALSATPFLNFFIRYKSGFYPL
jgi:hypothetical protein